MGFARPSQLDKIKQDTLPYGGAPTITLHTFAMYQLSECSVPSFTSSMFFDPTTLLRSTVFAIITSAIISGSVVGKMK
jgi:ammonia channel protein AmtB